MSNNTYRLIYDEEEKTISVRELIFDEAFSTEEPIDYSVYPVSMTSDLGQGVSEKHIEVCRAMKQRPLKGGCQFPQPLTDDELEELYENTHLFI